jgi:hypothetical protein
MTRLDSQFDASDWRRGFHATYHWPLTSTQGMTGRSLQAKLTLHAWRTTLAVVPETFDDANLVVWVPDRAPPGTPASDLIVARATARSAGSISEAAAV